MDHRQVIAQVLNPIYKRVFSESSYGYRPRQSAQKALRKASEYVTEGREVVVDMKIYFDEINHDRLMYELSIKIGDKILLRLIRKYVQSDILLGVLLSQSTKGTPHRSPLSPFIIQYCSRRIG